MPTPATERSRLLIGDYAQYLSKQLSLIDAIRDTYESESRSTVELRRKLSERILSETHSGNERRYVIYTYLEQFRRFLSTTLPWSEVVWEASKDNISGVWLANYKNLQTVFEFAPEFRNAIAGQSSAELWFHLELTELATETDDDKVGVIQLRGSTTGSATDMLNKFKSAYVPKNDEETRKSASGSTFYLVRKPIKRKDLPFNRLARILMDFHVRFGEFILHDSN